MKVGVIGLGSIGLRHTRNLLALGHEVFAYDTTKITLSVKDAIYLAASFESVLEKSEAIVIASPTSTHADYAQKAVIAEKPVFLEKPIADWLFPGADLITMVGYMLRFHPCVIKAKEWMDNGVVGKPMWANFTCGQFNDKPSYLRDGVILNWSHEIDLALHLLGPAKVIASNTRISNDCDDITDILLRHDSVPSSIHLDYVTKPEIRQSIIVGTKASIIMDLVNRNAWLRGAEGVMWDHIVDEEGSWDDDYVAEMKAFIDRVEGKETLGATGEDGLRVLEICLKVREQAGLK